MSANSGLTSVAATFDADPATGASTEAEDSDGGGTAVISAAGLGSVFGDTTGCSVQPSRDRTKMSEQEGRVMLFGLQTEKEPRSSEFHLAADALSESHCASTTEFCDPTIPLG